MDYISFLVRTVIVNRDVNCGGGQLFRRGFVEAVLLGSEDSRYVTGIDLFADGGIPQV
jgi:hypothetical protein